MPGRRCTPPTLATHTMARPMRCWAPTTGCGPGVVMPVRDTLPVPSKITAKAEGMPEKTLALLLDMG